MTDEQIARCLHSVSELNLAIRNVFKQYDTQSQIIDRLAEMIHKAQIQAFDQGMIQVQTDLIKVLNLHHFLGR